MARFLRTGPRWSTSGPRCILTEWREAQPCCPPEAEPPVNSQVRSPWAFSHRPWQPRFPSQFAFTIPLAASKISVRNEDDRSELKASISWIFIYFMKDHWSEFPSESGSLLCWIYFCKNWISLRKIKTKHPCKWLLISIISEVNETQYLYFQGLLDILLPLSHSPNWR